MRQVTQFGLVGADRPGADPPTVVADWTRARTGVTDETLLSFDK